MADTELLVPLAEIAGVFVGFGALIAVRSGGPTEPQVVAPMRAMVSMGMLTVMAALAPVTLGRFDLAGHQVWAMSGALVLAGWIVMLVAMAGTPEYRASWAANVETTRAEPPRLRWWRMGEGALYVLFMIVVLLTPIIILLGVAPDIEAALYYALVVLILLGAGWSLLGLVYAQRFAASA